MAAPSWYGVVDAAVGAMAAVTQRPRRSVPLPRTCGRRTEDTETLSSPLPSSPSAPSISKQSRQQSSSIASSSTTPSWTPTSPPFRRRRTTLRPLRRPFVTVTYAQSLDGSISTADGSPLALSSSQSLTMTHALRAVHDAIVVGVGTVVRDNPSLTTRCGFVGEPSPLPIVLDPQLRCPTSSALLRARRTRRPVVLTALSTAQWEAETAAETARATAATVASVSASCAAPLPLNALRCVCGPSHCDPPSAQSSDRTSDGRRGLYGGAVKDVATMSADVVVDRIVAALETLLPPPQSSSDVWSSTETTSSGPIVGDNLSSRGPNVASELCGIARIMAQGRRHRAPHPAVRPPDSIVGDVLPTQGSRANTKVDGERRCNSPDTPLLTDAGEADALRALLIAPEILLPLAALGTNEARGIALRQARHALQKACESHQGDCEGVETVEDDGAMTLPTLCGDNVLGTVALWGLPQVRAVLEFPLRQHLTATFGRSLSVIRRSVDHFARSALRALDRENGASPTERRLWSAVAFAVAETMEALRRTADAGAFSSESSALSATPTTQLSQTRAKWTALERCGALVIPCGCITPQTIGLRTGSPRVPASMPVPASSSQPPRSLLAWDRQVCRVLGALGMESVMVEGGAFVLSHLLGLQAQRLGELQGAVTKHSSLPRDGLETVTGESGKGSCSSCVASPRPPFDVLIVTIAPRYVFGLNVANPAALQATCSTVATSSVTDTDGAMPAATATLAARSQSFASLSLVEDKTTTATSSASGCRDCRSVSSRLTTVTRVGGDIVVTTLFGEPAATLAASTATET